MELSRYRDPINTAVNAFVIAQYLCERAKHRGDDREAARLQQSMDDILHALNTYLDGNKE